VAAVTAVGSAGGGLVVRAAGSRWFLPVQEVVAVLRQVDVIRIPGAVPAVRGMVHHRGRVLPVADIIRALALPGPAADGGDLVVVESGEGGRRFALAVDAVIELSGEPRTGLATLDVARIATAIFA
jgi:chemotaxis signal transduction protein